MYKAEVNLPVAPEVPLVGGSVPIIEGKRVATKMPTPAGYKILILIPSVDEKVGSVYLPDQRREAEAVAAVCGFVVAMGPDCYMDPRRFPSGTAYCKKGDWVVFRSYAGTRLEINGQEFRLINDDTVEAVVEDPRGIKRAGAF